MKPGTTYHAGISWAEPLPHRIQAPHGDSRRRARGQRRTRLGSREISNTLRDQTRELLRDRGFDMLPSETNFVMIRRRRPSAEVRTEFRKHEVAVGRDLPRPRSTGCASRWGRNDRDEALPDGAEGESPRRHDGCGRAETKPVSVSACKTIVAVAVMLSACGGSAPVGSAPLASAPLPSNRAPVATGSLPPVTVRTGEDTTVSVAHVFNDPDGDVLSFVVATSNVDVADIFPTGNHVRIFGSSRGSAMISVTAIDSGGLSTALSFTVTVENGRPQLARNIAILGNIIFSHVGQTSTQNLARLFIDPDGDSLTYSASSSNTAIVTLAVSGSTLTVRGVGAGSATITITATDPGGLSYTYPVIGVRVAS